MVRSARFAEDAILAAMERGDFYASTGVELSEYEVTDTGISLRIAAFMQSRYRVLFIGKEGRVLREVAVTPGLPEGATTLSAVRKASPVSYEWRGDEGYVRVKIIDSNGLMAWTQPVMAPRR